MNVSVKFVVQIMITCVGILSFLLSCSSYAAVVTKEKIFLTNPQEDPPRYSQKYPANPRHQFILTTKGIKRQGSEELLVAGHDMEDSNRDLVTVGAKCLSATRVTRFVGMLPTGYDVDPMPVLVCGKGEGLYVAITSPHNPDPNHVRYFADLTRIEDENERQEGFFTTATLPAQYLQPMVQPTVQVQVQPLGMLQQQLQPRMPMGMMGMGLVMGGSGSGGALK